LASERAARPATLAFLGGAGTVTGSRFLVETGGARVLVDCGLFQGEKELRLRNWERFPVEPGRLDAVVLTHAHLDHAGYLPALVRDGFQGPVHATAGTVALAGILLPDSGRLHEEDAAYANAKGYSKHVPALPLYTEEDAERAVARLRAAPYDRRFEVARGVRATLRPAGHILGAASVLLELDGPPPRRLLVSGDLGRPEHPFLVPPASCPAADVVLVESTYGERQHASSDEAEAALAAAVSRTAHRGGVAVIPAFAVDRTEVVLHHLARLAAAGRIPPLPVYVDSPLALAALGAYRRAIAEGSPEIRPELRGRAPGFESLALRELKSVAESQEVQRQRGPFVVISASGMATGGRVLHHLRARLPDHRNTIILVGFQARGTRGWRLQQGERTLKLLGRYLPVEAEVVDLGGFSVHADADEILGWLRTAPAAPELLCAVHGEPEAAAALAARAGRELGWNAAVPRHLERLRL
jgi:metallo-beta-lactamase family protein